MSDFETAARPYSKAIYELASEQQSLPYWSDILQIAGQIVADEDMQALITSPSIVDSQLSELFISVMKPEMQSLTG